MTDLKKVRELLEIIEEVLRPGDRLYVADESFDCRMGAHELVVAALNCEELNGGDEEDLAACVTALEEELSGNKALLEVHRQWSDKLREWVEEHKAGRLGQSLLDAALDAANLYRKQRDYALGELDRQRDAVQSLSSENEKLKTHSRVLEQMSPTAMLSKIDEMRDEATDPRILEIIEAAAELKHMWDKGSKNLTVKEASHLEQAKRSKLFILIVSAHQELGLRYDVMRGTDPCPPQYLPVMNSIMNFRRDWVSCAEYDKAFDAIVSETLPARLAMYNAIAKLAEERGKALAEEVYRRERDSKAFEAIEKQGRQT